MIFMRSAGDQQCNGFECSVDRKAWEGNLLAKLRGVVGPTMWGWEQLYWDEGYISSRRHLVISCHRLQKQASQSATWANWANYPTSPEPNIVE